MGGRIFFVKFSLLYRNCGYKRGYSAQPTQSMAEVAYIKAALILGGLCEA